MRVLISCTVVALLIGVVTIAHMGVDAGGVPRGGRRALSQADAAVNVVGPAQVSDISALPGAEPPAVGPPPQGDTWPPDQPQATMTPGAAPVVVPRAADTEGLVVPASDIAATVAANPPPQQQGQANPPLQGQPNPPPQGQPNPPPQGQPNPMLRAATSSATQNISLQQAISDEAQLKTMAFDGLSFLTGSFNYDTFLPPGKISDYFSFQYMRDIDAAGMGHNTNFLTRIAGCMLDVLSTTQVQNLAALAQAEADNVTTFALTRMPLMVAFRQNMNGSAPIGSKGLNRTAVKLLSQSLYVLDGHIAYKRAIAYGNIIQTLDNKQVTQLIPYKFGDYSTWTDKPLVIERIKNKYKNYASTIMGMAAEMFSWYKGTIDSDTYFCPERHAMYFGGFGYKTLPAKGQANYSISTGFTADGGEAFMYLLNTTQNTFLTDALNNSRTDLSDIVTQRRAISTELRKARTKTTTTNYTAVISLSKLYGQDDGDISYLYACAFASIWNNLSTAQRTILKDMRIPNANGTYTGPFLYADPISAASLKILGSTRGLFLY